MHRLVTCGKETQVSTDKHCFSIIPLIITDSTPFIINFMQISTQPSKSFVPPTSLISPCSQADAITKIKNQVRTTSIYSYYITWTGPRTMPVELPRKFIREGSKNSC